MLATQNLGPGMSRQVVTTGANGICETMAVCGDVQVVAVGANPGANMVAVRPAAAAGNPATPLAGSTPNLAGQMDVWTIVAHEVGHFNGLGENNGANTGSDVTEGFTDGPYNVPAGSTLTFTINGNPVNVNLTAGNPRTAAQIAADINNAIAAQQPGAGNATATPTGGVHIQSTIATWPILVTGGTAVPLLGMLTGESGMSTMNQPDPRGLTSLDQRTLSRHDSDGLNFLYTPDYGDAPDPLSGGNPSAMYPSLVHTTNAIGGAAGILNGVQLFQPGQGAGHVFGYPPFRFEWLGAAEDGNANECEALVTDQDQGDDGMSVPGGELQIGVKNRITVSVSTFNPPGAPARYVNGAAGSMLYFNGYIDLNLNQKFDGSERLLWWSGVPGATNAASANFVPGASNLGTNPMTLAFDLIPPDTTSIGFPWARARLDYGEDEGRVANTNGDLQAARGLAQFGEVEDQPLQLRKAQPVVSCFGDQTIAAGESIDLQFSFINAGDTDGYFVYQLLHNQGWTLTSSDSLADTLFLDIGESFVLDVTLSVPDSCTNADVDTLCWTARLDSTACADTCYTRITCDRPVPVQLADFGAIARSGRIELEYRILDVQEIAGVHVYRSGGEDPVWSRLTGEPIRVDRREVYRYTDGAVEPDADYRYTLGFVFPDGTETRVGQVSVRSLAIPFAMGVPFPNPSSNAFSIDISNPVEGPARIQVFDVRGRLVRELHDGPLAAGDHRVTWDGRTANERPAGSGVYFMRYRSAGNSAIRRMLLIP